MLKTWTLSAFVWERLSLEPNSHYNQLMMDLGAFTSIAIACCVVKPAQTLDHRAQSKLQPELAGVVGKDEDAEARKRHRVDSLPHEIPTLLFHFASKWWCE